MKKINNLNYSMLQTNIKHIHFIGISGISMRGLATYTLENFPIIVTGNTDIENFSLNGIVINDNIENFINNINICVCTSSILDHNVELQKIKEFNKLNDNKIIILKRSEYLNLITSDKERIAVLGAHGKTSITTYTHQLLKELHPITFVGANVSGYKNTYLIDTPHMESQIYIVENDESENGFLNLNSTYTILPNISDDHLENYNNSLNTYIDTFKTYFQLIKDKNKCIIYNKNNIYGKEKSYKFHNILNNLVEESNLKNISYGDENCHVNIKILQDKEFLQWKLTTNLEELKSINNQIYTVNIIGVWNIYNITSSIIIGTLKNIKIPVNLDLIKPGRRLEVIYNNNKIILDDYGVHPFEIENVINACEKIYKNITYIWEPHRISRLEFFKEDFKKVFHNKNLFYTDVYEVNTKKENGENININDFIDYGTYIAEDLKNIIKNNSTIVLFSAGNLSSKVKRIIEDL
jgi:UDP-N-acetylmuramate--alanine ligase